MTIGELFVNIGVKGSDSANKKLSEVHKGLKEIGSSGIAAKAAIVGILYGIERMVGAAGEHGQSLLNFESATGLSGEKLQQWQVTLRRAGATAETTTGMISGLQKQMTAMSLYGTPPPWITEVSQTLAHAGSAIDPAKMQDTFYMMGKIQEYVKLANPAIGSSILSSLIGSPEGYAALRNARSDIDAVGKSEILSEAHIQRLAKMNSQWKSFGYNLELIRDRMASAFGSSAISALSGSLEFMIDMAKNLKELIKEFPALKVVAVAAGLAICVAFAPVTTAIAALAVILSDYERVKHGGNSIIGEAFDNIFDIKKKFHADFAQANKPGKGNDLLIAFLKDKFKPKEPQAPASPASGTVIQHFHGKVDYSEVKKGAKDGLTAALTQLSKQVV